LPYVTDLLTLSRSTEEELEVGPGVPELRWRGYEEVGEERFGEVLEATYEGSQDMPELVGVRGVGEMRAGQEAIGRFEADLWLVGEVEGEPGAAGVLVLADGEERGCMEVVYLGLTVGARGRGLGRRVVAEAVRRSRGRRPRLELGVDERNGVALRLYRRVGFREVGRRSVYLRVFGG
jgi:ribosomal protein S18 acetylase RimI-like enzyme